MKKILICLIIMCGSNLVNAQKPVDSLLIHEWLLESYRIDGKSIPLSAAQKASRHIFYRDHTCKAIDDGIITPGTWIYDSMQKTLTITNQLHPEITTILKIEQISAKTMKVKVVDEVDEADISISMKAVD